MIVITGDTHANVISRLSYRCRPELRQLKEKDIFIILGDCGIS